MKASIGLALVGCGYIAQAQHIPSIMQSPNIMVINSKLWNELPADQQKVIEDAAKVYADYQWELLEKSEQADKKFLEENGITFTTPSEEFMADMEKAAEPLYEGFYKEYPWAEDLVKKIKAEVN